MKKQGARIWGSLSRPRFAQELLYSCLVVPLPLAGSRSFGSRRLLRRNENNKSSFSTSSSSRSQPIGAQFDQLAVQAIGANQGPVSSSRTATTLWRHACAGCAHLHRGQCSARAGQWTLDRCQNWPTPGIGRRRTAGMLTQTVFSSYSHCQSVCVS